MRLEISEDDFNLVMAIINERPRREVNALAERLENAYIFTKGEPRTGAALVAESLRPSPQRPFDAEGMTEWHSDEHGLVWAEKILSAREDMAMGTYILKLGNGQKKEIRYETLKGRTPDAFTRQLDLGYLVVNASGVIMRVNTVDIESKFKKVEK